MVKNPAVSAGNVRDTVLIPGLARYPGVSTHSSILAWRILWTEEPGGYSPWGPKESDMTEHTHTIFMVVWALLLCL